MSTLFGILSVGRNGMMAHQVASQTASHNATNASTLGYTRRMANIESVQGPPEPGLGSRAKGARRVIDPFLERRMLGARTFAGEASGRAASLAIFDQVFVDSQSDIGVALDDLTRAFGDLAVNPGDPTARTVVLARAEAMGASFRTTAESLDAARFEMNERISFEAGAVNDRLHQIAELGQEIAKAELHGNEAGNLRDRRDQLVREVSDHIPVKVIEADDGKISLLLEGSRALVSPDGQVNELVTQFDPGTGDVRIQHLQAGELVDINISGGRIGGIFDARDGALTTTQTALDQLAFDITTAYNTAHSAGFGMDGVSGRDLFEPSATVAGAASSVGVAAALVGNPDAIAAAADGTLLPGDNRVALELTNLAEQSITLGGTASAVEGYAALVGVAATELQQASFQSDGANAAVAQVEALRQSVSGVSVDEAMLDLMQYQRGFQASLKVIQTADEMLGELMNLKR